MQAGFCSRICRLRLSIDLVHTVRPVDGASAIGLEVRYGADGDWWLFRFEGSGLMSMLFCWETVDSFGSGTFAEILVQ